jgi:branched-chain amino acid transport system substrate-binding protein
MRGPKTIRAGAIAAIVALAAIAPARAACEVKFGALGPLSGPAAQWGLAVKGAAEFVAAEENAAGGLQVGPEKCRVTVTAFDAKYNAEGAAAGANYFVSQGVRFVIGPVGSPEMTGVKPIAARNNLLVMGDSFAKNAIGPQWPLVFHSGPGPSGWAPPIVDVAKQTYSIKSVVIVAPNDQGGTDIASVDAEAYRRHGVEPTEEYYQRGTSNFAAIAARIIARNPDAVDTASSPPGDAGVIVKQLRQAGYKGVLGRLGGSGTEEIARVAGGMDVLQNFYWYENVVVDERLKALAERYRQLVGAERPENTLFFPFVAATRMVTKAIAKAGTATDTKAVAAALRTLPVDDPDFGQGRWIGQDFYGINQELSFPFGIGLIVDGKARPIAQHEAATGK